MTFLVPANRGQDIEGEFLEWLVGSVIVALLLPFFALFITGGFLLARLGILMEPGGGLYAGIAALLLVDIPAFDVYVTE
ncbi:MAG: hypothetical protein V3U30_02295 [Thermoplasmata archaeon]